jgi:type IV pilus assembly protein PilM
VYGVASSRTVVGLDIGTAGVRAAELSVTKEQLVLRRFGQVALPPGAVKDGEVVDTAAVTAALRQLWSSAKFGSKKVVVGVANQKVVVRQIELPWLPPAELKASLPFQVQDYVPMPIDEAILDLLPLEEHTDDSGLRLVRGLLVAASREMVNGMLAAVTGAGLQPTMVDLTPFAVLRCGSVPDELQLRAGSGEAEALVDVGANVTNIVVHQNGMPRFVRILLMGGDDITEAVAERLGIPLQDAEAAKRTLGLAAAPGADLDHPGARALEHAASALVEEVRGTLDYYLAQPTSERLRRVVLSGGGSCLPGLVGRLSDATHLPVDSGDPLGRLQVGNTGLSPEQLAQARPVMTVPVGLALGVAS